VLALAALPASASAKKSTDLRMGFTQAIDNINPYATYLASSLTVALLNWDNLVNSRNSDLGPDFPNSLISGYDVSKDGLTWTFHVRKGLRWSDGAPLTAKDIAFTMNLGNPATNGGHDNSFSSDFEGVKRFDAPNPLTAVAHLSHRSSTMLDMTSYILPEHVWQHVDPAHPDKFKVPLPAVGSGPYTLQSLDTKGTSVMVRNRYFRGTNTGPQRVLITFYGTNDEMAQDLALNRLDFMSTADPAQYKELSTTPNVKVFRSPGNVYDYFNFNLSKNPAPGVHAKFIQDPQVRRAINTAIDRRKLAATAYLNLAQPASGILSPFWVRWYHDFSKDPLVGYAYDPAKARAILEADGWKLGANGVRSKDGTPAEFLLYTRTANAPQRAEGKLIQAMLADVGIKMTIQEVTDDKLNAVEYNTAGGKLQPDFDSVLWDLYGARDPNTETFAFLTSQINGWNDSGYSNPAYDKLFVAQNEATTDAKRKAIITQMQRMVLRDNPYMFLVNFDVLSAANTRTWKNWTVAPQPLGQPITWNWLSVTDLVPGEASASTYRGVWWVITGLAALLAAIVGRSIWARRREAAQPLEVPESERAEVGA
jgi:peptide/nickel transport system substrate-binding protein